MRDYLNIGPVPYSEDCAQAGSEDFRHRANIELSIFKDQLERQFPDNPINAYLTIRWFSHDFGSYGEVICIYDSEDQEAVDYALKCETDGPELWDSISLAKLKDAKIPVADINRS